MIFDELLLQYGVAGVFILYLIFDRQILLKGLQLTIKQNTEALLANNGKR